MTTKIRRSQITVWVVGFLLTLLTFLSHQDDGFAKVATPETGNVVNGDQVDDSERWPWMVSLQRTDLSEGRSGRERHACGGSVIAPDRILTAAHCVSRVGPKDIDVVTDRPDLRDTGSGEQIDVVDIAMYPDALQDNFGKDVAVLKLAEPSQIEPVDLVTPVDQSEWNPGQSTTLLGYGLFDDQFVVSDVLRKATLTVVGDRRCNYIYTDPWWEDGVDSAFDPASMICAQDPGNPKTVGGCHGDSGGPLVVGDSDTGYRQLGVVSWGLPTGGLCDPNYPSVFAKVPALHSFIVKPFSELAFKPYLKSKLQVLGQAKAGRTLSCAARAGWANDPDDFKYSWDITEGSDEYPRGPIEGATSSTYKLRRSDLGKRVSCKVTASNEGGFHTAVSDLTSVVTVP